MNKFFVLAAFALGVAMTHQALACDWDHEASKAPVIVADCSGTNCATEQPTPEPDTSKTACNGDNCAKEPAVPAPNKLAGE